MQPIGKLMQLMLYQLSYVRAADILAAASQDSSNRRSAADAGSPGVGRYRSGSKRDRREIIMASRRRSGSRDVRRR
jgi:hypothetical protein